MPYNLTGLANNTTTIVSIVQGTNSELLFGWGGILFLIGMSSVMFLSFFVNTRDVGKAVSGSLYTAFGLSIFLGALGLIPPIVFFITLVGTAASLAFLWEKTP